MTTTTKQTLSLLLDIDPDTPLDDEALDGLSFHDRHAVAVLRDAYRQRALDNGYRRQLGDLITGRKHYFMARPVRIGALLVLGVDETDPKTLTDAVFTEQRDAATYWRFLVGGKLAADLAESQAQALLLWLEASHHGGRVNGAAYYAARVLDIPLPD